MLCLLLRQVSDPLSCPGFPASVSDILPIPVDYPDGTTDFAIQPGVPAQPVPKAIGKRHENASHNARMLVTPEEPLVKQALAGAQDQYESLSVTAAHDLMVLSVERRQEELAPSEAEGSAASEGSSSDFWTPELHEEAAAPIAAEAVAAKSGAEGHAPAAVKKPAKDERPYARQRPPVEELEWDPVPQPQEVQL